MRTLGALTTCCQRAGGSNTWLLKDYIALTKASPENIRGCVVQKTVTDKEAGSSKLDSAIKKIVHSCINVSDHFRCASNIIYKMSR